jgi:membrane-bound hydrogenase subunit beta
MAEEKYVDAESIVSYFKDEFKTKMKELRIEKRKHGLKKMESKKAIKHLCDLQFPHLAVISGNDLEKSIELIYHFSLNYGMKFKEISLNIGVDLPKSNPTIETICDYIPGALISEREKQEFLGVKIEGIPDSRRLFLPDDFPKDVYPWRRDSKGMEKVIHNLHEVKK